MYRNKNVRKSYDSKKISLNMTVFENAEVHPWFKFSFFSTSPWPGKIMPQQLNNAFYKKNCTPAGRLLAKSKSSVFFVKQHF
jgi:hypothetical protein